MGPNKVVNPVFSNKNLAQPSQTTAGFSQTPKAGYPSGKRTFKFAFPKRDLVIRTIGKPESAVTKETKKTSSVPPTETVTSEKDKNFVITGQLLVILFL